MNTTLAGVFLADLANKFPHDDSTSASNTNLDRIAELVKEVQSGMDPVLNDRNTSKRQHLNTSANTKKPSGTNDLRDAIAHAQLMLPETGHLGSAARANHELWCDRWSDEQLWRGLHLRHIADLPIELDEAEHRKVRSAFARVDQLFPTVHRSSGATVSVQQETDAVHAACDLATAVSAVSTNRAIGREIREWVKVSGGKKSRFSKPKTHGRRLNPGIAHVTRVKKKIGVPSVKNSGGTPRKGRADTKKANALRKLIKDIDSRQLNNKT